MRQLLAPLLLFAAAAAVPALSVAAPKDERHSGAAAAPAPAATAARTISFAGRTWTVKDSAGAAWGPGPNRFSASTQNVWVDAEGRLHLAITRDADGRWSCAEVIAQQSLGHGTYRFTIDSPLDALDPNVVLGLFTWSDQNAENHREIDIEFARWGDPGNAFNGWYTVQPYTVAANQRAWAIGPGWGRTEHRFRWTSRSIDFASSAGGTPLQSWSYTRRNGVPRPGNETPRINLWLFGGAAPLDGRPVEIVVAGFVFTP
jgi:hypothetical protein